MNAPRTPVFVSGMTTTAGRTRFRQNACKARACGLGPFGFTTADRSTARRGRRVVSRTAECRAGACIAISTSDDPVADGEPGLRAGCPEVE